MSYPTVKKHNSIRLARKSQATQPAVLSEVFATSATDASAMGFVLSRLPKGRAPVLWIQDHVSRKEAGQPYLPGLPQRRLVHLRLSRPLDVLWAMEEGLRCKALSAVIGEIWGDPPALSFTATKRLAMRAEAAGLPCWIIRRGGHANLSAARNRFRVTALPARPDPHDAQAPGDPRWQVELFRSRTAQPGTWIARYDRATDRVDLSAPFRDGALAEEPRAPKHSATR